MDLKTPKTALSYAFEYAKNIKSIFPVIAGPIIYFIVAIGFVFFFSNQWCTASEKNEAEFRKISEKCRLEANFYLAKLFEEKALSALKDAQYQNSVDAFKNAALYASAALDQELPKGKKALKYDFQAELINPYKLL